MNRRALLATAVTLLLSACDDTYIQNDTPYGGGSWGVSDRTLVRNCEEVVAYRIHRRLGRDARVRFDRVRVYHSARDRARVEGDAHTRDDGEERRLEFRCTLDRRKGVVLEQHLDWRSGGGQVQGKRNRKALEACKDRIRERLHNEIQGDFHLDFRDPRVEKVAERMRRVSGEAVLENRHGQGRITYSCKVHLKPLEVYSTSWRWTRRLPTTSAPTHNSKKARKLCHNALRTLLTQRGHHDIRFADTRVERLSEKRMLVKMKVHSRREGQYRTSHHSCRVNVRNGRILDLR